MVVEEFFSLDIPSLVQITFNHVKVFRSKKYNGGESILGKEGKGVEQEKLSILLFTWMEAYA